MVSEHNIQKSLATQFTVDIACSSLDHTADRELQFAASAQHLDRVPYSTSLASEKVKIQSTVSTGCVLVLFSQTSQSRKIVNWKLGTVCIKNPAPSSSITSCGHSPMTGPHSLYGNGAAQPWVFTQRSCLLISRLLLLFYKVAILWWFSMKVETQKHTSHWMCNLVSNITISLF